MSIPGAPLELPQRTAKPRDHGVTGIMDLGVTVAELEALLDDYHTYIDLAKLGVGTGYITPKLAQKIALYKHYAVGVYFGGTLFEKFYEQGKLEEYLRFVEYHELEWIELSNGTLPIELDRMVELIERLAPRFNVIAEVGSKDPDSEVNPCAWEIAAERFLAAGCRYVVLEARSSGNLGLYHRDGTLRQDLMQKMLARMNPQRLIFEAPVSANQVQLLNLLGSNVNLGNIPPRDVLFVEAERLGLRSETFYLS